jgi:HNH endonuclease
MKEVESRVRLTPPARFGGGRTHAPRRCDGAYPTEERLALQMRDSHKGYERLVKLWFNQNGICPQCGEKITRETGWHLHHKIWVVDGGDESLSNLILMHPTCHQQLHAQINITNYSDCHNASAEADV